MSFSMKVSQVIQMAWISLASSEATSNKIPKPQHRFFARAKEKVQNCTREIFNTFSHKEKVAPTPITQDIDDNESYSPQRSCSSTTTDSLNVEDQEEELDELYFGAIRHIPEVKLREVARKHLYPVKGDRCWVQAKLEGSFNRVHIIQFIDGSKYCIRVPASGTPEKWTEPDAFMLRSQALTINYIKRKTGLPVAEVFAYSNTCDNELGHPYLLTEFLDGNPICDIWDMDVYSPALEKKRINILKSLAQTISALHPLMFDAAGSLYFANDDDEDPQVGPGFRVHEQPIGLGAQCTGVARSTYFDPAYSDSHSFFKAMLTKWWKNIVTNRSPERRLMARGEYKILSLVIDCLPTTESKFELDGTADSDANDESDLGSICGSHGTTERGHGELSVNDITWHHSSDSSSSEEKECEAKYICEEDHNGLSNGDRDYKDDPKNEDEDDERDDKDEEKETFVLAPPDFDWQNILIDSEGNVTGILDWDQVATVPRYLGWAAHPNFLSSDYDYDYTEAGIAGSSAADMERYRKAYAEFMKEVMEGNGDCKYTGKSHLFACLPMALEYQHMTAQLVEKFLRPFMPRTQLDVWLVRIGDKEKGFYPGELNWLRARIKEFWECKPGADHRFSF